MLHRRTTLQTGRLVYFEYCCWFRRIRRFGCGQLLLVIISNCLMALLGRAVKSPHMEELRLALVGFLYSSWTMCVALLQPGWESYGLSQQEQLWQWLSVWTSWHSSGDLTHPPSPP